MHYPQGHDHFSPMVFSVRDVELHATVVAEVSIQPGWLCVDLVQDSEQQLFGGYWGVEYAHALPVGDARMSPYLDESIAKHSTASNVRQ